MPETDTLPTERAPDRDQPQAPQGPAPGSFQSVAEAIGEWKGSSKRVREGLERKAEATAPLIDAAEKELQAPRPTPPTPPSLPAPPSRQLTEFLAPVEGESPTTSITKLLQAVGLFATGISGAAKGDARAGLAAFTGAMKGWQEGDIIRADRHFADWEAKTHTALTKWKTERQTYQDIMESMNLSQSQRQLALQLAALREGNKMAADVFEMGNLEKTVDFLTKQQAHEDSVQLRMAQIIESKQTRDRQMAETERHNKETEGQRRVEAAQRHSDAQAKFGGAFSSRLSEGGVDLAAAQLLATGKMPPLGAGMAGTRTAILERAEQLRTERGQSQGDVIAGQQLIRAAQNGLNTNIRMATQIGSFIKTADANIKMAEELSDKVHRTGVPLLNAWIQVGQRQIEGDPDITNFDKINASVAAEFARVMESATGGGVSTVSGRAHAMELLNTAQTPAQYKQGLRTIHQEMHNRVNGFKKETEELQELVKRTAGGGSAPKQEMPAPPPLANDPLGIRR